MTLRPLTYGQNAQAMADLVALPRFREDAFGSECLDAIYEARTTEQALAAIDGVYYRHADLLLSQARDRCDPETSQASLIDDLIGYWDFTWIADQRKAA